MFDAMETRFKLVSAERVQKRMGKMFHAAIVYTLELATQSRKYKNTHRSTPPVDLPISRAVLKFRRANSSTAVQICKLASLSWT